MPIDLSGTRSKIDRAKKHILDFNAERIAFLGTNPYVVVPKFDAKRNFTQSILGPLPTIPANLALIAGDAAHCLRTALDYLACELVRSTGASTKGIYFPIAETAEKYRSPEFARKTKGMPVDAKKIIDQIAPYQGGNGEVLWFLHLLDIADKHIVLISIAPNLATTVELKLTPEPTEFSFVLPVGLKEGEVLGEVAGNCEADQRINFAFDIAFGHPAKLKGKSVFETLQYLAHSVETIVNHFGELFG